MEDYQAAFLQRHQDQIILDKNNCRIASMHFGGIVIECLLKQIIMASLPCQEWKTEFNSPGHTTKNPKHNLIKALQCNNRLYTRMQNFPEVFQWLNMVERPYEQHFIDLRYSGNEVDPEDYRKWLQAYNSLKGWLQKQATQL